jgi:hypothetical protein
MASARRAHSIVCRPTCPMNHLTLDSSHPQQPSLAKQGWQGATDGLTSHARGLSVCTEMCSGGPPWDCFCVSSIAPTSAVVRMTLSVGSDWYNLSMCCMLAAKLRLQSLIPPPHPGDDKTRGKSEGADRCIEKTLDRWIS